MMAQYETQLVYRREDENGDMVLGAYDGGFVSGLEAMRQVLKTRLYAGQGEWWEGDDTAVPWFSEVLGTMLRKNRLSEINMMIVNRIMDTVGVTGVKSISSGIVGREFHFSCTVSTVYGELPMEVNV